MMRGLAVAGPRPSQGVAAKIKNADIEDVSQLGVELLARPASGLGQRRLTHRNPDLRVTSIDQRGAPIPAVRGTEIERQGSTLSRRSLPSIAMPARAPQWPLPRTGWGASGAKRTAIHSECGCYSMTSSARARTEGGIVSPSALAVLRLTTSLNLVGCCTGRSAGLAPFKILST